MKKIIIDLDNTLLDTERFKGALFHSVKPHISRYIWDKTYQSVMKDYIQGYNYTYEAHAALLSKSTGIKKNKILKQLASAAKRLPDFLYHDAIPFLKLLQKTEHELILLTYGNKRFQSKKIKQLKIAKYFDKIILTEKKKHLTNLGVKDKGSSVIFINDNPFEFADLKRKYPKAVFVRKITRFKNRKVMKKEFPPFRNIQKIQKYLQKNRLI